MSGSNGKWLNPLAAQYQNVPIIGTTVQQTFQSLSSYLGGWVEDKRSPIVKPEQTGLGGARGNAAVESWYKVQGDECWWIGSYVFGSTTTWAATQLGLFAPFPANMQPFPSVGGVAVGWVKAYNGTPYGGVPDIGVGGNNGPTGGATINPFTSGGAFWASTVPFTWDDNHQLAWSLKYRIQV